MSRIVLEHESKGVRDVLSDLDKLTLAQQKQVLSQTSAGASLEAAAKRRRAASKNAASEQDKLNKIMATGAKVAGAFGIALGGAEVATAIYRELNAEIANTIRLQEESAGKQTTFVEKVTEFTQSTALTEAGQKTSIEAAKNLGAKLGEGGDVAVLDALANILPKIGEDRLPEAIDKLEKLISNTGQFNPNQDFGTQAVNAIQLGEIFQGDGLNTLAALIARGGASFNETNESLPQLIPALRGAGTADDAASVAAAFQVATGAGQRVKPAATAASSLVARLSASDTFQTKDGRRINLQGEDAGDKLRDLVDQVSTGQVSQTDTLNAIAKESAELRQFLSAIFASPKDLQAKADELTGAAAGQGGFFEAQRKLIEDVAPEAAGVVAVRTAEGQKAKGQLQDISADKAQAAKEADLTRERFGISTTENTGFLGTLEDAVRIATGKDTLSEIQRDNRQAGGQDIASFRAEEDRNLRRDIISQLFGQFEGAELGPDAVRRTHQIGTELSQAKDLDELARRALETGAVSGKAGLTKVEQQLLQQAGATDEEVRGFRLASQAGDVEKLGQLVDAAIQRILADPPPQQAEALSEAKKQTELLQQIADREATNTPNPPLVATPPNAGAL